MPETATMARDALSRIRGAEAEIIPPDLTPARLLGSLAARWRFRDRMEETQTPTPWRVSEADPTVIIDAEGRDVLWVDTFEDDASNARLARLLAAAVNACATGTPRRAS